MFYDILTFGTLFVCSDLSVKGRGKRGIDDGGKRVMREITLKVNVLVFSFKIIKMYEKVKSLFLLDP